MTLSYTSWVVNHGRRQTFSLGGGAKGGQGAGHVGVDISHGRALDECMDNNWGEAAGEG